VPLVVWPGSPEPFTSVKWHLVSALAAGWLLVERFLCGSRGLPPVVVRAWPAWVALAVSVVAGSLRHGLAWAVPPLTARATFVALALASFWYFRRTGLRLAAVRAGTLASATVVVALGLAQLAGFDPLACLPGGDRRSATFGNVNMAAQFAGLAVAVLLAVAPAAGPTRRRAADRPTGLVAAGALAYAWLAGTRSVGLALIVAVVVLLLVGRVTVARLLRVGAAAALLVWLVLAVAPAPEGPHAASARESKRASALWRLAVWEDTLALVRDHPEGVGAGNFEHAFIPYALAGRSKPGETVVFRSPHNDYLRLVAEEGIAGALLLLGLLFALARGLHRSPAISRWRSEPGALLLSCGAFFLVEAFFQFPFEMAFPALLSAVLLGLALACAGAPGEPAPSGPDRQSRSRVRHAGDAACALFALAIGGGVARAVAAEVLLVEGRGDARSLEQACALDPRRLEACLEGAWLRGRAGDHRALREAVERALRRSPHYFPALKLLGEDLLAAGERAAACRYLRRYDGMFGGRSSVSGPVHESCTPAVTTGE
jgi:O-antigen ligase